MKALKITSIVLTVLIALMAIAGFFVDNYLGQIGNFIWDTVHLLVLTADLVIFAIYLKKQKSLREEPDESPDSRA